jgi:dTDP-4-amino-4,6-dideoxygalactose transaminase
MYPKFTNFEIKSVIKVLKSGKVNYWTGNKCKEFEKKFSKFHNLKYGVAVSNGSVALEIALRSLNLPKNSEVIVTPRSFVISATCVLNVGLKPTFADVDELGNLSAESIKKKINKKTSAVIPVHIDGSPCDMEKIRNVLRNKNIKIIEDCSQAHGAKFKNKLVGSFGDLSIWSFCNDKIMSTGGEGGMICTNNFKYYKKCWSLKDHGKIYNFIKTSKNSSTKFRWLHNELGSNYRMTEIQGAIGLHQLKKLNQQIKTREIIANTIIQKLNPLRKKKIIDKFNDKCNGCKLKCKSCTHVFYRFNIFLNKKFKSKQNVLIKKLIKKNISAGVGSCPEIYKEKVFKNIYNRKLSLGNSNYISKTIISLKLYPTLPQKKIDYISNNLSRILSNL